MGPYIQWKDLLKPLNGSKTTNLKVSGTGDSAKECSNEQIAIISAQRMASSERRLSPNESVATTSSGVGTSSSSTGSSRTIAASGRSGRSDSASGQRLKLAPEKEKVALDKSSMQLSIAKVSPLGMLLNQHNKVGSSFLAEQQFLSSNNATIANDNQQAALLAAAAGQAAPTNGGSSSTGSPSQLLRSLPVGVRKARDSGSLLFMLAFLGFLGYIIWDGVFIKETDLNLIIHGHDSFGNICGRDNKPIKFADKSGQNFTGRPYTKYTLINSQFERYTIESSRSKHGELVYIKEEMTSDEGLEKLRDHSGSHFYDLSSLNQHSHRPPTQLMSLAAAEATIRRQQPQQTTNGSLASKVELSRVVFGGDRGAIQQQQQRRQTASGASSITRLRRQAAAPRAAASLASESKRAQQSNNGTFLKSIKSNLMYQYPPMYGYSSEQATSTPTTTLKPGTTTLRSSSKAHVSSEQKVQAVNNNNKNSHEESENSSNENKPNHDPIESRESVAQTSTQQHAFGPRQSAMTDQPLGFPFADHRFGPFPLSANNDSEHMLVTPISVHLSSSALGPARRPSGGSPAVLGSSDQLLYLTECVSSCPRDHVELVFYRCMPNNWRFSLFPNAINVTRTFIDEIITDLSHCYRELIYTFSLALVLSLGLLILLRFLASLIIWCCIFALISLFLSLASYSWLTFYYQILELNSMMPHEPGYAEKLATSDKWLVGSIFLTFVAFAAIGAVVFMRKRILLVTMLFRESGKAIADMPLLLLQPLLTFAALGAITIAWSAGLICLQSMKRPVVDLGTGFVVFKAETLYKLMKWYHVFAFLWVCHFAIACQHYVIGASVSKWYFSSNRYQLSSPIGTSVSELILYYLGSVALGSFLVAIFKVIRIITRQIQFLIQRNCITSSAVNGSGGGGQQAVGPGNMLAVPQANLQASSSCCASCAYIWRLSLWFLDNIVMIINRDAYVEIAIHGHSFLAGARRAFSVLASNPLRLLAIKSVGNLLLVIAKICVVFATVSVAYVLVEEKKHALNYSWSPVVVSAIYAYVVAHWFLSVYEMVIDALFICYCEDYELGKNRQELARQIRGSNFMAHILNTDQAGQAMHY